MSTAWLGAGCVIKASDARFGATAVSQDLYKTRYAYNQNDQVTLRNLADAATGAQSATSTSYAYDRAGNLLATKDELGHVSGSLYDAAGDVIETDQHPQAGVLVKTTNLYDVFGRLVSSVSGDGYTTTGAAQSNIADFTTSYTYGTTVNGVFQDSLDDHATEVTHGVSGHAGFTDQTSTYDAQGHRLSAWDGTLGWDGTHETTNYSYDKAGHLIKVVQPTTTDGTSNHTVTHATPTTLYTYDEFGHLWQEKDADGNTASWSEDYFGRFVAGSAAHTDFGGTTYTYTYDNAGQLLTQTNSAGENLAYWYDAAGQQTMAWDRTSGNQATATAYDALGNHVHERVQLTTGSGSQASTTAYQDNLIAYDDRDQLSSATDRSNDTSATLNNAATWQRVGMSYDAVGNRTEVTISLNENAAQTGGGTNPAARDYFFSYDGMNRQLHLDWQVSDPTAQLASTAANLGAYGHTLVYDADGNRLSDTFMSNYVTDTGAATTSSTIVGPDGRPVFSDFTTPQYSVAYAPVQEAYSYDSDDRLTQALYTTNDVNNGVNTQGWVVIDQRTYDGAGRVTSQGATMPGAMPTSGITFLQYLDDTGTDSQGNLTHGPALADGQVMTTTYDEDGNALTVGGTMTTPTYQFGVRNGSLVTKTSTTYVHDAVGNVKASTLVNKTTTLGLSGQVIQQQQEEIDSTFNVVAAENYETLSDATAQTEEQGQSLPASPPPAVDVNSTTTFDAEGRMTGESDPTNPTQAFVYDEHGNILSNINTAPNMAPRQLSSLVVDGQVLGRYGFDNSMASAYDWGATEDFSFGYQSLESSDAHPGSSTLTAGEGESLDQMAQAAYGDSRLWQRIAQANGFSGDVQLQQGERVLMPGTSGTPYDASGTYAVDEPGLMQGDLAPHNVTSTAMSDGEKREFYQDVHNTPVPQYSGNKGASQGQGLGIAADDPELATSVTIDVDPSTQSEASSAPSTDQIAPPPPPPSTGVAAPPPPAPTVGEFAGNGAPMSRETYGSDEVSAPAPESMTGSVTFTQVKEGTLISVQTDSGTHNTLVTGASLTMTGTNADGTHGVALGSVTGTRSAASVMNSDPFNTSASIYSLASGGPVTFNANGPSLGNAVGGSLASAESSPGGSGYDSGAGLTFAQDHADRMTAGSTSTPGNWLASSGGAVPMNNFVDASNVPSYALTSFTPGGEDVTFAEDHLQRQQIGAQFVDDRLSGVAKAADLPGVLIDSDFRTSEHAYTQARQDDLDRQNAIEFLTPGPTPILHGAPHALPLPATIAMPVAPTVPIPAIEIPTDPYAPQFWNAVGDASPALLSAFAADDAAPGPAASATSAPSTAGIQVGDPLTLPPGHTFLWTNAQIASRWNNIRGDIVYAANEAGIDAGSLAAIATLESGFDDQARPISISHPETNRVRQFDGVMATSSAYGLGQITNGTWLGLMRQNGEDYGVDGAHLFSLNQANTAVYRTDVDLQLAMFAELTSTNITLAQRYGGGADDIANLYAMHNLGGRDGPPFLSAVANSPDALVSDVLPASVVQANHALYGNGSITVQQAYQNMSNYMAAAAPMVADARRIQHQSGH